MMVIVEGFKPLLPVDGGNCFYGPCSRANSNLAGTAAILRERVRVAGRVVSVLDDKCHRIQKNHSFVPLFPCAKYRISKTYVGPGGDRDELDERNERDQGDERVVRGILRNHGERNIVSGCNRRHGHLTAPISSSQRPVVDPRRRLGCDGGFKPTSLGTSTARSVEKRYRYVKVPNEECPSPRTNFSKMNARNKNEMYSNNWKELTRTMIAVLGPDLAYGLFCIVFIVAYVLEMLTIPWMVLALCGYRYTLHLNLVGLKVRRNKDGKVVYGTMGRNRFGMDFLRGRFGLLVMSNLLVKSQAYTKMPDGCKDKPAGVFGVLGGPEYAEGVYGTGVRDCYPRKAVDEMNAAGSGTHGTYGPMEDWDMSLVTDISGLFYLREEFNADISKWDVSSVTNMFNST